MAPDIPRRSRRVSLGSPSRPFSSLLRCRRADGGAEAGALGGATGASRRADLRRDLGALRGSRRLVGGATASRAWRPQTRSKLNLTASPLPRLLASERRAETVEPDCHRSVDARRCRPMAELRHVPSNGCGNAGTVRGTHIKRPRDIGGGIRNEGGMLTLVESTISGNTRQRRRRRLTGRSGRSRARGG